MLFPYPLRLTELLTASHTVLYRFELYRSGGSESNRLDIRPAYGLDRGLSALYAGATCFSCHHPPTEERLKLCSLYSGACMKDWIGPPIGPYYAAWQEEAGRRSLSDAGSAHIRYTHGIPTLGHSPLVCLDS